MHAKNVATSAGCTTKGIETDDNPKESEQRYLFAEIFHSLPKNSRPLAVSHNDLAVTKHFTMSTQVRTITLKVIFKFKDD